MTTELLNMDCMEYMAGLEDNAFDLAIVDPPYGAEIEWKPFIKGENKNENKAHLRRKNQMKKWDNAPTKDYFDQVLRCAGFVIIWGGNYFANMIPNSNRWICFEKRGMGHMPQFELAWTNCNVPNKIFSATRFNLNIHWGKLIHPTQKPVALYKWLLHNYAKTGQRILDTHLGSGSSAIAAHYFGCDFVGMEIDKDYFDAAVERFNKETRQIDIFQP